MKRIFQLTLLVSIPCITFNTSFGAQYWAKTYGVPGNHHNGYSIRHTLDGNYVVAGQNLSGGGIIVMKIDQNGKPIWQKTYNDDNTDFSPAIEPTSDGSYIVSAWTTDTVVHRAKVMKLDSNGDITWQKVFGENISRIYDIKQTNADGYIVVGSTFMNSTFGLNAWILKLDSGGEIDWQKTYDNRVDVFTSIQQTLDGGYIVGGNSQVNHGYIADDFWVLKLDSNGDIIWEKTFGGGGSFGERLWSIEQTSDGGYIVAGQTYAFGAGGSDAWVLKLDSTGTISWQKTYGGIHGDSFSTIHETSDGGYIATGSQGNLNNDWIVKLDTVGNIIWQKIYTTSYLSDIQQTSDGYIVAGSSSAFGVGIADIFVLKLDENGEIPDLDCDIVGAGSAIVDDTAIGGQDTTAIVTPSNATSNTTEISPQEMVQEVTIVCSTDYDDDGVLNPDDNCPFHPNGPEAGTCTSGHSDDIDGLCIDNADCGTGGFCSMNQEDSYPPTGNGCGDACECEGNFNDDDDQDGSDAATFKIDFGRSEFVRPCTTLEPCNGDFDCDGDSDGSDAAQFKLDFGRSQFSNPCPLCVTEPWCIYPVLNST